MRLFHAGIFAIASAIFIFLAGSACAQSTQFGNRVWDESKGLDTTYTWNSFSYAGFYYNLDDNLSTEQLTISNIDRNLAEGDVRYTTTPIEVNFEYSPFGKYQVIGFMADKYFAGYTANSVISGNRRISVIGSGQLQRVLLDDEDRRTVFVGGTLTLNEGYVLKMKEIDVGAGPGQILVGLLKDGVEIDTTVVSGGGNYIYSKRTGSVSDLPVIAVHFESVFRGREVNAAFVRGVFQISELFTRLSGGDRYGAMAITTATSDQIAMENRDAIDLSPGNTIDLMGNLKIIVADNSSVLRFALSAERTGTYEVRGTIFPITGEWTPLNFGLNIGGGTSVGFYYDMDKDIGSEKLSISQVSGTSIPDGGLGYSTSPQEIDFDFSPFGSYQVIGFMADKYFAGYTANSVVSGNRAASTIGSGQLQKVLLDDDNRRVLSEGGTLTLKEGYVLRIREVDIGAGPGQVLISLLKDGEEVDSSVVSGGNTYLFSRRVGSVSDLVTIAVRFESVFRGREVNAAFTRGIFQISEAITQVKSGDTYGQMEVRRVGAAGIEMNNPNSIDLSPGSTVDLMGNVKFRVANAGEVRFYPFVTVVPEMVANQLVIEAPVSATAGDTIRIKVTAGGNVIEGASVEIDSVAGLTDRNGIFEYALPRSLKGTYNITSTMLGFQKASRAIEVLPFVENALSIEAPAIANQFDTITLLVTFNGTAISGATVSYDNATIGSTDNNGAISYMLENSGTRTITASASGYITASRDIVVRPPFTEFRALDINITPDAVPEGQSTVIRSNVTNAGTKAGTLPVVLIVNSTEVDNSSVTLSPQETKEIIFTHKVDLPAGNYTVEILGQKRSLEVKPAEEIPFGGMVIGVWAILFVYLMKKRFDF